MVKKYNFDSWKIYILIEKYIEHTSNTKLRYIINIKFYFHYKLKSVLI